MTWTELEKAYSARIEDYVPKSKKEAQDGFNELGKEMEVRFPEAYTNPLLIIETEWRDVVHLFVLFGNDVPADFKPVTKKCVEALRKVRAILTRMYNFNDLEAENLTADSSIFTKPELIHCFSFWMQSNGYTHIKCSYNNSTLKDITAQKEGINIICKTISSVKKMDEYKKQIIIDQDAFKSSLGRTIVSLMGQMQTDKNAIPIILVADDKPTLETLQGYTDIIKKTGIKIYAVYSVRQAIEL